MSPGPIRPQQQPQPQQERPAAAAPPAASCHLWRASAAAVTARLGFAPAKLRAGIHAWRFTVLDEPEPYTIWVDRAAEAYGVFSASGPRELFAQLFVGTGIEPRAAPPPSGAP